MWIEIVVLVLMTTTVCRYLEPLMDWFDRERGTGPGKNGWV